MELRTIPVGDFCFSRSNKILQCFLDESTLCAPTNLNCLFSDSVSPSKRSNIIELFITFAHCAFLITCWERGESNVLNNNFDKIALCAGEFAISLNTRLKFENILFTGPCDLTCSFNYFEYDFHKVKRVI